METKAYTIPTGKREIVEKLITRYQKKAAKYGATLRATFGEPYAKKVAIYKNDYERQEYVHVGDELYEVVDLEIESEVIKQSGYEIVAKLEHLDGGNIVTMTDEIKPEWLTMPPYCEHCHGNHGQRTTFIVRHESGLEKQVGKTCLKEYCGLDPQAIGWAYNLGDAVEAYDVASFDFHASGLPKALDASEILIYAVSAYRKQGYVKSDWGEASNKALIERMRKGEATTSPEDRAKADELAEAIKAMSHEQAVDALLGNIKSIVQSGYCRVSDIGFMAYAPKAYADYVERQKQKQTRMEELEADRKTSRYVGEVGERMTFKIKGFKFVTAWETQFGITHLYKFTTTDGNVLMWFASSAFGRWVDGGRDYKEYTAEEVREIVATVKSHNERDGVKQTIISRVKAR